MRSNTSDDINIDVDIENLKEKEKEIIKKVNENLSELYDIYVSSIFNKNNSSLKKSLDDAFESAINKINKNIIEKFKEKDDEEELQSLCLQDAVYIIENIVLILVEQIFDKEYIEGVIKPSFNAISEALIKEILNDYNNQEGVNNE